ncbi:cyclin dependent kinase inhibitor 1Bb [Salminus brasiliensis]|uniref:cyclin dependent kinase inhibitor 1Bb n=1 Tax=Salminus brasiliensis TaxID=930266 RepID=UPI003B8320D2
MSNVRLSNGSPTLERMDARLSDQPKPSACRSLFGPVDHEELKKELKGHLRAMEEASTESWNFDFSSFTPLPHGRYLWAAVDSTDLPSFYSSTGNKSVDVNGNHERLAERSENPTERREQHVKSQRKRPSCLDSSCQSKRSHTCVDEVSCRPGLTQALDHTPVKSSPQRQT